MSSQFADFLDLAQHGQEMSQETLSGVTLIFVDQGNAGGYAASSGPLARQVIVDTQGTLYELTQKAFRIRRELIANDGLTIVPQKTKITVDGRAYVVDRIVDRPGDPALYLACKE